MADINEIGKNPENMDAAEAVPKGIDLFFGSKERAFFTNAGREITEGILKEILDFIVSGCSNGSGETSVKLLSESRESDYYTIPEDMDISQLYLFEIDYNDEFLESFIKKYFTIIDLEYKDGD